MREEWQLILSEFSVDAAQNGAVSSLPIEAQLEAYVCCCVLNWTSDQVH